MKKPAYYNKLEKDPQRLSAYQNYRNLFLSWENECEYLEDTYRRMNDDGDAAEMEYALKMIPVKKSAATHNYAKQYSRFQIMDKVQVVENNRVVNMGEIRDIGIMLSNDDYKRALTIDPRPAVRNTEDDIYYYMEDEFFYTVYCRAMERIHAPYRERSPLIIYPKPSKMYSTCFVCGGAHKPQQDIVVGGEPTVLCMDCIRALNDIFGDEYVRSRLTLGKIPTLPEHKFIQNYSDAR